MAVQSAAAHAGEPSTYNQASVAANTDAGTDASVTTASIDAEMMSTVHGGKLPADNNASSAGIKEADSELKPHQLAELSSLICNNVTFVDRQGGAAFDVAPWDFVAGIRTALQSEGIHVTSLKLEGSAASHCLNKESVPEYSDLDFVFHLGETTTRGQLEKIRGVLAKCLADRLPHAGSYSGDHVLHTLVHKQYISPPSGAGADAWAVYAIKGSRPGTSVDLKFVQRLARPYQFSADSFAIVLNGAGVASHLGRTATDNANNTATSSSGESSGDDDSSSDELPAPVLSAPSVHFESSFESASLALQHLANKHIAVKNEADLCQVRGGGLLKYARFLSRGWTVAPSISKDLLQRYMVTRFMCDYPLYTVTRYGTFAPAQQVFEFVEERYTPGDGIALAGFFSRLEMIVAQSNVPGYVDLRRATQYVAGAYGLCLVRRSPPTQMNPPQLNNATQNKNKIKRNKKNLDKANAHSKSCPDLLATNLQGGKGAKHSRSPSPVSTPLADNANSTTKPTKTKAPRNRSRSKSPPQQRKAAVTATPATAAAATATITNPAAVTTTATPLHTATAAASTSTKPMNATKGSTPRLQRRSASQPIIMEGDENVPCNRTPNANASAPSSPVQKQRGNVWQKRAQTHKQKRRHSRTTSSSSSSLSPPASPKFKPSPSKRVSLTRDSAATAITEAPSPSSPWPRLGGKLVPSVC